VRGIGGKEQTYLTAGTNIVVRRRGVGSSFVGHDAGLFSISVCLGR
jgi:hypothetical protein